MRVLPAADDAVLVEVDDLGQAMALHASLVAEPLRGVVELVPGARTVLLRYEPAAVTAERLVEFLRARTLGTAEASSGTLVEIPVHYDGDDLAEVAAILGLSEREVVERHTGTEYRVAFTGFAPGFAYLSGGDPALDVPRRATPRTRIPAGSVGLAGTFSGVYPRESPGGWQLIGVTDVPMWDLSRETPALLQPGDRVRFVEARGARRGPVRTADATSPAAAEGPTLEVRQAGIQSLVQDLGRAGHASLGVSPSGALDRRSLREANRLVGNEAGAAGIEVAHGGLVVVSRGVTEVAVTGAVGELRLVSAAGESAVLPRRAIALEDGEELHIGAPARGVRAYLAVRHGLEAEVVLGSRSTDTLSGLGPPALAPGTRLSVRRAARGIRVVDTAQSPERSFPAPSELVVLDVVLGPRSDWFTHDALELLQRQEWHVTPRSNRVGLRLDGAQPLERTVHGELPSEGTVTGAIQVPADGQPVLFLADHPLTGGYPVIGAVASHHLDLAGQLPAGCRVRFRALGPFHAFAD
ncbi:5-oxoprolinase subunit PxpB [Salinibacterium sp. GXW1014]|uniref:5-oxoprolinase subunit PxpB n=1 Tax=Salinibacterium sp. GXW1014 TaxID=3377838 RepID=UPI00383B9B9C